MPFLGKINIKYGSSSSHDTHTNKGKRHRPKEVKQTEQTAENIDGERRSQRKRSEAEKSGRLETETEKENRRGQWDSLGWVASFLPE